MKYYPPIIMKGVNMKVEEVVIRGVVEGSELKSPNEEKIIEQFKAWFESTEMGSRLVKDGYNEFDSETEGVMNGNVLVKLRYDKE